MVTDVSGSFIRRKIFFIFLIFLGNINIKRDVLRNQIDSIK